MVTIPTVSLVLLINPSPFLSALELEPILLTTPYCTSSPQTCLLSSLGPSAPWPFSPSQNSSCLLQFFFASWCIQSNCFWCWSLTAHSYPLLWEGCPWSMEPPRAGDAWKISPCRAEAELLSLASNWDNPETSFLLQGSPEQAEVDSSWGYILLSSIPCPLLRKGF